MKVKHFVFSTIAAAFLTSAIPVGNSLEVGENAPKIEMTDGSNVGDDAKTKGKTKVISFWNPKKPASRISNRELNRLYADNQEEDVEFISICTDSDESLMKEVMKIDGVNTDKSLSYSQVMPRVFKDYGVEESPKAFKITPDGKIAEII